MRVAGLGFSSAADVTSLRAALIAAGGSTDLTALATVTDKADAAVLRALAEELRLPIWPITPAALAATEPLTHSARVLARFGIGSLAEAAALAAAGPGARLLSPRTVSADHRATAAIAEAPDGADAVDTTITHIADKPRP